MRVGVIKTCEYLREHCSEKLKITSTGPVHRSGLLNIYTPQATCTFCRQPDTAHAHTIYGHEGRTVNGLSLPLSVSIKSYSERCFSSSLTGSSNVSEKEKKRSMFLSFSMHSTGCQSVNESTTNFFHLFLFCDWLNRVPNTLLTSSVFMFLPDNSVSPLTLICFKSLLSKQVTWSTFFCLSRSCSLEQIPAQHPACVFHSLFQNCSKTQLCCQQNVSQYISFQMSG